MAMLTPDGILAWQSTRTSSSRYSGASKAAAAGKPTSIIAARFQKRFDSREQAAEAAHQRAEEGGNNSFRDYKTRRKSFVKFMNDVKNGMATNRSEEALGRGPVADVNLDQQRKRVRI